VLRYKEEKISNKLRNIAKLVRKDKKDEDASDNDSVYSGNFYNLA